MSPTGDDGARTTEQVYSLVERLRTEVLSEIKQLETKVESRFASHLAKHEKDVDVHSIEHTRDADRRAGLIRWAVTTIVSGIGVLLALYVAFRG